MENKETLVAVRDPAPRGAGLAGTMRGPRAHPCLLAPCPERARGGSCAMSVRKNSGTSTMRGTVFVRFHKNGHCSDPRRPQRLKIGRIEPGRLAGAIGSVGLAWDVDRLEQEINSWSFPDPPQRTKAHKNDTLYLNSPP